MRERDRWRTKPTSEDVRVLRKLNDWSVDGYFSCVEDIMKNEPPQFAQGKLKRLRHQGWAEKEEAHNTTWWRITQEGRDVLLNKIATAAEIDGWLAAINEKRQLHETMENESV